MHLPRHISHTFIEFCHWRGTTNNFRHLASGRPNPVLNAHSPTLTLVHFLLYTFHWGQVHFHWSAGTQSLYFAFMWILLLDFFAPAESNVQGYTRTPPDLTFSLCPSWISSGKRFGWNLDTPQCTLTFQGRHPDSWSLPRRWGLRSIFTVSTWIGTRYILLLPSVSRRCP